MKTCHRCGREIKRAEVLRFAKGDPIPDYALHVYHPNCDPKLRRK